MPIEPVNLIGAGGQAAVVLDALLADGVPCDAIRVWTQDEAPAGAVLPGIPIDHLARLDQLAGSHMHVCIGDNVLRQRLQGELVAAGAVPRTIIHPAAIVSPYATVGGGSFIAARAVLAPRSRTGQGVIINHGAIVDHDCVLGNFVHVAPGATLGGAVHLADCALIGAGANILPCRHIGTGAIVGAGSVVLCDMPEDAVYVGVPAAPRS